MLWLIINFNRNGKRDYINPTSFSFINRNILRWLMKLARGDILKQTHVDAICITTNGVVKKTGECVMGRGIAQAIKKKYPGIDRTLGELIRLNGNITQVIIPRDDVIPYNILAFPVKPISKRCTGNDFVSHMNFNIGDTIPGWACKADVNIIRQSAINLVDLVDNYYEYWDNIILPYAGCGAGELNWEKDICPILSEILDDRFTAMTF